MNNQKIKARIECNKNGFYTVYCEEELPFGCFGEGRTADAARMDFLNLYKGLLTLAGLSRMTASIRPSCRSMCVGRAIRHLVQENGLKSQSSSLQLS